MTSVCDTVNDGKAQMHNRNLGNSNWYSKRQCRQWRSIFKGGYLDFSHLTESENIHITEIHTTKQ